VVEGVATSIPADVAILEHPDFVAATHSTVWVEQLDLSSIQSPSFPPADTATSDGSSDLREVTVEVDGRRYDVKLRVPEAALPERQAASKQPARRRASVTGTGSGTVMVPMQGTIVKIVVAVGDTVEVGQTVCVLEAMKMENAVTAEKAGTVKEIRVTAGASVGPGDVVAVIE
jgi:acetyl-CoA/propionyl-CoA carboxylase biotin carboxyl carrier protein